MTEITGIMEDSHKYCDDLFAQAESAVAKGDWAEAATSWNAFAAELDGHITCKEEGLLFPAFEKAGGPSGPTYMMRADHEQMRALVKQIDNALQKKDASGFLGCSETLMMLMQQHNMKEEQILYPMLDQFVPELAAKIK